MLLSPGLRVKRSAASSRSVEPEWGRTTHGVSSGQRGFLIADKRAPIDTACARSVSATFRSTRGLR